MENINIPKREKIRIRLESHRSEEIHFHRDFEVLFLLNGEMLVEVDDVKFPLLEGNFLIINSNSQHSFKSENSLLFLKISINYELVRDIVGDKVFYFKNDMQHQSEEVKQAINELLHYYLNRKSDQLIEFAYLSICYKILDVLSYHYLEVKNPMQQQTDEEVSRVQEINDYINLNYNQGITLQSLSDYLYLTPSYLSKYFKRKFGMNFKKYLNEVQLSRAYDEVLYTDKSIKNIAFDNGFTNITYFSQKFLDKFSYSPKELRKQISQDKSMDYTINPEDKIYIQEYLNRYSELENRPMVIETTVLNADNLPRNWENMINIGQASDLLSSNMQEHILLLKRKLGFQYVRFWNVFSKELLISIDDGKINYNFTKLNLIFDFLVQNNLKPHIEVEPKPKIISKNSKQSVRIDESQNTFSVQTFSKMFDIFLKHLINRYGLATIEKWRFELWFNEWQFDEFSSFSEYFSKFSALFNICKKYSPNIKVGGCGYSSLYSGHIDKTFFDNWHKKSCPPDFISVTSYAYERLADNDEYSSVKSHNSDILHDGIEETKKLLKKSGFSEIPIYVTEWNLSFSDRNFINDTCFKGAYILENMINNLDNIISYHYSSDQVSEYFDSRTFLYGGLGLMTRGSIFKPATYAYEFLHQLDNFYLSKNKNYLVTTDMNDSYTIICHNKQELSPLYYTTDENDFDIKSMDQYFLNQEANYKFIIHDVVSGNYKLEIKSISPDHGSILDEWGKLNFYNNLSLSDIEYLKGTSIPRLSLTEIEAKNNRIVLNINLQPNEFVLIKLKKI